MYDMLNIIIYITLWYLFNSNTKEISNTKIVLEYLLLEKTSKKLNEKKALLNYFNKF